MTKPLIIGLCGAARSGKDTVATMLAEALSMRDGRVVNPWTTIQIAGPLKRFVREVFDWTEEHTDGSLKETPDLRYPRPCSCSGYGECALCNSTGTTYLTPRQAMQTLGDDWSTPLYEPIWAVKAANQARRYANQGTMTLVTDCRFLRDIEALRAVGSTIIQVHRNDAGLTGAAAQHRGEVERNSPQFQALVSHHIYNDGTLEDLQAKVQALAAQLTAPTK